MTRRFTPFSNFAAPVMFILGFILTVFSAAGNAEAKIRSIGSYDELGEIQFFVGMYSENPYTDANDLILSQQDKAMEIRVVANKIFSRRFKRMWQEGAAINSAPAEYKKYSNSMVSFSDMLQLNLEKGDILRLERNQATGMSVILNGNSLGKIVSPEFFDLLVRVLVGPVPISVDLKSELVSGKVSAKSMAQFTAIKPGRRRQELIPDNLEQQQQAILAMSAPKINAPIAVPTNRPAAPKVEQKKPEKKPAATPVALAKAEPKPRPKASKPTPKPEPKDLAESVKQASTGNAVSVKKLDAGAIAMLDKNTLPASLDKPEAKVVSLSNFNENDEPLSESGTELVLRQGYYSEAVTKIARGITKTKERAPMGNTRLSKTIVRVNIIVRRNGGVKKIDVVSPSTKDSYNKAAVIAVQQSVPFARFSDKILDDELEMTVPIAIDWLYVTELDRAGLL